MSLRPFLRPSLRTRLHNKWYPFTSGLSTLPKIAVVTQFHAWLGTKIPTVFLSMMEKPLDRYCQVWSPYYQVTFCNQKLSILVSSRSHIRSEKAKKGLASTFITAATSVHLLKSVLTDLIIQLNQPNRKWWGARRVDVTKELAHKVLNELINQTLS